MLSAGVKPSARPGRFEQRSRLLHAAPDGYQRLLHGMLAQPRRAGLCGAISPASTPCSGCRRRTSADRGQASVATRPDPDRRSIRRGYTGDHQDLRVVRYVQGELPALGFGGEKHIVFSGSRCRPVQRARSRCRSSRSCRPSSAASLGFQIAVSPASLRVPGRPALQFVVVTDAGYEQADQWPQLIGRGAERPIMFLQRTSSWPPQATSSSTRPRGGLGISMQERPDLATCSAGN